MGIRERIAESRARLNQKKTESEQPALKQVGAYVSESPPGSNKLPSFREPPKVVGTVTLEAKCGHGVAFDLYADAEDKHRQSRSKKLTDRDCPDCRRTKQEAKEMADQAKRQERLKNNPPKTRDFKKLERLPDGSTFNVKYHADERTWKGWLHINHLIPVGNAVQSTFYDEAPAVFKLLSKLDAKWRAFINQRKETNEKEL